MLASEQSFGCLKGCDAVWASTVGRQCNQVPSTELGHTDQWRKILGTKVIGCILQVNSNNQRIFESNRQRTFIHGMSLKMGCWIAFQEGGSHQQSQRVQSQGIWNADQNSAKMQNQSQRTRMPVWQEPNAPKIECFRNPVESYWFISKITEKKISETQVYVKKNYLLEHVYFQKILTKFQYSRVLRGTNRKG